MVNTIFIYCAIIHKHENIFIMCRYINFRRSTERERGGIISPPAPRLRSTLTSQSITNFRSCHTSGRELNIFIHPKKCATLLKKFSFQKTRYRQHNKGFLVKKVHRLLFVRSYKNKIVLSICLLGQINITEIFIKCSSAVPEGQNM